MFAGITLFSYIMGMFMNMLNNSKADAGPADRSNDLEQWVNMIEHTYMRGQAIKIQGSLHI